MESVRVDKWLWAVRLFRTRSLATEACRAGHVRLGGDIVKPARDVRVGEVLTVKQEGLERKVRVTGLLEKRVGAGEVPQYMEDLTPPEVLARRREEGLVGGWRERGAGRPTKRDRRALESFLGE